MTRKRLILLASILLVVLIGVETAQWLHSRRSVAHPVVKATTAPGVIISTTTPDEAPPQRHAYPALPTGGEPEQIGISSLDVNEFVQRVSVDQQGAIAVPTNIHLAGWFTNSVSPGEPGLSIIDGHVDGRVNAGIFKRLADVKVGDKIKITLANALVRNFSVMKVQTVPTAEANTPLFSQDSSVASQLNLITCGGTFNTVQGQYDMRVIVSAKLVSGS